MLDLSSNKIHHTFLLRTNILNVNEQRSYSINADDITFTFYDTIREVGKGNEHHFRLLDKRKHIKKESYKQSEKIKEFYENGGGNANSESTGSNYGRSTRISRQQQNYLGRKRRSGSATDSESNGNGRDGGVRKRFDRRRRGRRRRSYSSTYSATENSSTENKTIRVTNDGGNAKTKTTPSPSERFTAKSVPRTSRLIPNTMCGIQKQHKKRKYNINTYRVFIDDVEMSDLQVASYAEDNKKKIQNQGHRMLTRVKKFMTCGEFFPKKWTHHMVLTSICVFNRFFSIKNIMATHEFSAQTKEYLKNKMKEYAPKSFYEFWTSNASNAVTSDLTQSNYVDKVCRYMQNSPDGYLQLIEFFKKMKSVINYYHGPLQYTHLSLLSGNKKVPERIISRKRSGSIY